MNMRSTRGYNSDDLGGNCNRGTEREDIPEGKRKVGEIKEDRKSLSEFDRSLAAGPDVPADLPETTDIAEIEGRLLNGKALFRRNIGGQNGKTDVIVGLDVGSTATKIVLRIPYSEDIGLPVPAPKWFRAEDHPYYWRTLLWRHESGDYSIEPRADSNPIDRLKVNLLDFDRGDRQEIKIAMVAWIVLMARQGIGWLRSERPRTFRNGKLVVDEVNVGMPFTTTEEAHPDQNQIARAASQMLEAETEVTADAISKALRSEESETHSLVDLRPELSGALHGFLNSHQRQDGRYLLADIGGLTIDTVFFSYVESADPQITVYSKSVECFGSDVISKWCEQIASTERAKKVLGNHVAEVSKKAIKEKIHISADSRRKPLELETILIGGGRHSKPHRDAIEWCEESMANHIPPLKLIPRKLQPDRDDLDIDLASGRGVDRLLVAMGLSYTRYEQPDIRPPSEVRDVEPESPKDISKRYIGPEQC